MNFSYALRLMCLCFASFFLVHTALGIVAAACAPMVGRLAEGMRARSAARLLLGVRLAPAFLAVAAVVGLCVPSYLWFEAQTGGERVGIACLAAALLGGLAWAAAFVRVYRGIAESRRYARRRGGVDGAARVSGQPSPVSVVEETRPVLLLCGIFRSRIIISRSILSALPAEQLDAALRHEQAHRASRDNFKRLLMLLLPGLVPFSRGFAALERGWEKAAEWAADDAATGGDQVRAVALAAALVRVARMGVNPDPPLVASLTAGGRGLEARVDRLLRPQPLPAQPGRSIRTAVGAAVLASGCAVAAVFPAPSALFSIHRLLEVLLR
ncbi:MAG TPA: M48 family metalloprotease [Candidatus Acidoferrales bacterium]|nr:M48 family metalloprotease [Candidatus Acidoferrales bacterium]